MKIYLLLNQPYPYGFALTKRFHLYAKGFVENGNEVKMLIPKPIETGKVTLNKKTCGVFEGVPYKYFWYKTSRSQNFFIRRFHDFKGTLMSGIACLKGSPDIIVTSTFSTWFFLYLRLIAWITGSAIVREKNEVDFMDDDHISFFQKLRARWTTKLFEGYIVINNQLRSYMISFFQFKKARMIVVPILTEECEQSKAKSVHISKTIVYTGTYLERKDGILTILKALARVKDIYPDYKLIMTGKPERSKDYPEIKKIIKEKNLDSHIQFTGYLTEMHLRELLQSAGMLILAKPDNRQNHYNFPTKIGEYLVSGRPVISTKVGVIGEIMEDGLNVLFADMHENSILEKIEYVIENPKEADEIGKRGKEFAIRNFCYLEHTKRMEEFFINL